MHVESATRGPYKDVRRTYNYSIFFSRWRHLYKPDLVHYVKQSLQQVVPDLRPRQATTVVNYCTVPNWPSLIAPLEDLGVAVGTVHDLSGFLRESEAIDLYRTLPLAFQSGSTPLTFVVDHFRQLSGNHYWFRQRSEMDLVIDRHANCGPTTLFYRMGE